MVINTSRFPHATDNRYLFMQDICVNLILLETRTLMNIFCIQTSSFIFAQLSTKASQKNLVKPMMENWKQILA